MPVADTSLEAYDRIVATRAMSRQQKIIMDWFYSKLPQSMVLGFTRGEIAEWTGLRLSSVCGRVNELICMGILEELPRRICSASGGPAHPVKPRSPQLPLFS